MKRILSRPTLSGKSAGNLAAENSRQESLAALAGLKASLGKMKSNLEKMEKGSNQGKVFFGNFENQPGTNEFGTNDGHGTFNR